MRCYLARLKWILFSSVLLSLRTSYVIVPLLDQFSFDSGMLWFLEKEVGAKFQELKLQCVRAWGEN